MKKEPVRVASGGEAGADTLLTWEKVEEAITAAEMYWVTSLQDGVPHTVPVIGIWWEGAWYSCNPRSEQKYKNLNDNPVCQALTGHSVLAPGLDIAIHGMAEEMPEMEDRLRFARQMAEKYPEPWRFEGTEEDMWVYRLVSTHIRAFHRLDPMGFARWDFRPSRVEPDQARSSEL